MKKKKLTLKYILKDDIYSPIGREGEKAVYIRMSYNRKNTSVRSTAFDFIKEENLKNIENTPQAIEETKQIERIMSLETNDFTASIDKLNWFRARYKFYLTPIKDVYSEYGIKLISRLLLYGKGVMASEEIKIINELRDFLPFTKYLKENGEYYKKTNKRPHVFISMIHGFIINQKLKPEYEELNELKHSIEYYLRGYNCLSEFLQSDYIQNRKECNMINWVMDGLDKKLNDFIKVNQNAESICSNLSAEVIEVGLIHSDQYSDIISKNPNLSKLRAASKSL